MLRCCPFLLCYNVGKQVNTDNKHKSFTVLVRFFCLDTVEYSKIQ